MNRVIHAPKSTIRDTFWKASVNLINFNGTFQ